MNVHKSEATQIDIRARLIEQNKKLRGQIVQLSVQVNEIIQKKGANTTKKQQINSSEVEDKKKQLRNQEHYINKLKTKIQELKSSVMIGSDSPIRKQQDKVTILRRELRTLQEEKSILQKLTKSKTRVLKDRNEPHEQVKSQLQDMIASTKLENKQLQDRALMLDRLIRREHEFSVTSKQIERDSSRENGNFEQLLPSLEAHIQKAEEQKKAIDEKWNGKIKYVDTQMLQLRSLFDTKKRRLDELLKEVRNWEIRKYVFRDEDQIKEIKERLAKLPVKPRSQTNKSKATSMSMMESKPYKADLIRRSTSKEKFKDVSPPVQSRAQQLPPQTIGQSVTLTKKLSKEIVKEIKLEKIQQKQQKEQKVQKQPTQPSQIKPLNQSQAVTKKQIQQQTTHNKSKAQTLVNIPPSFTLKEQNKKGQHGKDEASKPLNSKDKILTNTNKNANDSPRKNKSLARQEDQIQSNQRDMQNEFMDQIESYPLKNVQQQKREKKLLKSVAVGTTFYYNGD